jgi:hypothetical protein
MILHDERKKFLFFLRRLVKGQDHSFFKDLTGVFVPLVVHLFKFLEVMNDNISLYEDAI